MEGKNRMTEFQNCEGWEILKLCNSVKINNYGMTNISKIYGAVLSAWGFAGLAGNQASILVSDKLGFGYLGVVTMLVVFYSLNFSMSSPCVVQ